MPNARQKLFLEGPIGTALTRLAIPIMLGNLLQTGYQLTDAFWVSTTTEVCGCDRMKLWRAASPWQRLMRMF